MNFLPSFPRIEDNSASAAYSNFVPYVVRTCGCGWCCGLRGEVCLKFLCAPVTKSSMDTCTSRFLYYQSNSFQGILSLPNLLIGCSLDGTFWGVGRHVLCWKKFILNHTRIVSMVLVMSRYQVWGCFVCISFHWDVFLAALGRGCLRTVGRSFPCEFLCRCSHSCYLCLEIVFLTRSSDR